MTWNGTHFVATGNGSVNTLAYSPNYGTFWIGLGNSIFTSVGNNIMSNSNVVLASGQCSSVYVSVGAGSQKMAYSTNLTSWSFYNNYPPLAVVGYNFDSSSNTELDVINGFNLGINNNYASFSSVNS